MSWFDCSKGVNPRFAIEDYNELKKELNSNDNDFAKLNFLKFQYKEYLKSKAYSFRNIQPLYLQIEKEILAEIEYLEFKIKHNIQSKSDNDTKNLSNELAVAHNVVIRLRNKTKILEQGITESDLRKIIDDKCRKKNGKINYSALGKILGCSHHTAQKKCKFFSIS